MAKTPAQDRVTELQQWVGDLTIERNEAWARLRVLDTLAARTDNAVVITDAKGLITWVNESFTRISGYTPEESIGHKPGRLLQGPDTSPEAIDTMRRGVAAREPVQTEILNYHKDGTPYWMLIEIIPIFDEAGELTNFMAIESDITEAKEREMALRTARDAAEAANIAKSAFLANMSHEIRTPLSSIIGFMRLLREEPDATPEQRDEWCDISLKSSEHLLTLINDILDLSKIEAERMEFESVACAPVEIAREVAETLRDKANQRGVLLEVCVDDGTPATIQTDPTRLRQAITNLASNALKFTDEGSVRVRIGLNDATPSQLRIAVQDTGCGIAPEALAGIFEPFVQADVSVTRKHGGTGLGLTITRKICEGLGGRLEASSVVGQGSTFTATFATGALDGVARYPLESPEPTLRGSTQKAHAADNTPPPQAQFAGRVLLTEDGDTNRKLIGLMLRRLGLEVVEAEHGQMALDLIEQHGDFDIILLDMQMPVLDGYSTARALRERGNRIPIVALTAHALTGDRDKCLAAGCDDYLTKPLTKDDLIRMLTGWLRVGDSNENAAAA
ncbi:MAG: ATP-binding protein [Planctomycetota bacterium]